MEKPLMDDYFRGFKFDLNDTNWNEELGTNGQFVDQVAPTDEAFIEIGGFNPNQTTSGDDFVDVPLEGDITNDKVETTYKIFLGLEFDTIEMVDDYWKQYGSHIGFGTRIKGSNKSKKDGRLISKTYLCNREGKKSDDPRRKTSKRKADSRCGCPVRMIVHLNLEKGNFFVQAFVDGHNHPLVPKNSAHLLKLNRSINSLQASAIDVASRSGWGASATHRYMSVEAGGSDRVGFTIEDIKSLL